MTGWPITPRSWGGWRRLGIKIMKYRRWLKWFLTFGIVALIWSCTPLWLLCLVIVYDLGYDPSRPLSEYLADDSEWSQTVSTAYLAKSGVVAIPVLLEALESTNATKRAAAAKSLGLMANFKDRRGPNPLQSLKTLAVPALRRKLLDSEALVRVKVAIAMWQITGETSETLPYLVQAIKEANYSVSYPAFECLERMGVEAKDAIPVLKEVLKTTKDDLTRSWAKEALKAIELEPREKTK
jgi:hypothetical protein